MKSYSIGRRIPYQRLFSFGYILWRLAYLLKYSVASLIIPLRHTMLAAIIRVRRIEESPLSDTTK